MCRGETVRVGRAASGTLSAVDIPRCDIRLAQGNHAPACVERIAEAIAGSLLWDVHCLVVGRSGCSISCVTSRHEILSERSGRDWDAMVRDRNAGGARLGLLKSGRYIGCEGRRVELLCSTRRRHPRVGKVRPCWVAQSIVTHASKLGLLTIVDGHSHCESNEVVDGSGRLQVNKEEGYTNGTQLLVIRWLKQVIRVLENVGIETINGV